MVSPIIMPATTPRDMLVDGDEEPPPGCPSGPAETRGAGDAEFVGGDEVDEVGVVGPRRSRMTRSVVCHTIGIPSHRTWVSVVAVVDMARPVSSTEA